MTEGVVSKHIPTAVFDCNKIISMVSVLGKFQNEIMSEN